MRSAQHVVVQGARRAAADCSALVLVLGPGLAQYADEGGPSAFGHGGDPRGVDHHGRGGPDQVQQGGAAPGPYGGAECFDVAEPPRVGFLVAPVGGGGDEGEQPFGLGLEDGQAALVFGVGVRAVEGAVAEGEPGHVVEFAAQHVVQGDGLLAAFEGALGARDGDGGALGAVALDVGHRGEGVRRLSDEPVGVRGQ
ncbi:hypothetical protein [Streptomyces sp. NPDC056401]|uniref:hypothetical protein n=1 Tax=Streptomyces sp. NPDC056401 TaxID=3345809 RepID=UPI0035D830EE